MSEKQASYPGQHTPLKDTLNAAAAAPQQECHGDTSPIYLQRERHIQNLLLNLQIATCIIVNELNFTSHRNVLQLPKTKFADLLAAAAQAMVHLEVVFLRKHVDGADSVDPFILLRHRPSRTFSTQSLRASIFRNLSVRSICSFWKAPKLRLG